MFGESESEVSPQTSLWLVGGLQAVIETSKRSFPIRALCHLVLKQYKEAVKDCTEALRLDGRNVKAFYRRAQAYKALKVRRPCLKGTVRDVCAGGGPPRAGRGGATSLLLGPPRGSGQACRLHFISPPSGPHPHPLLSSLRTINPALKTSVVSCNLSPGTALPRSCSRKLTRA